MCYILNDSKKYCGWKLILHFKRYVPSRDFCTSQVGTGFQPILVGSFGLMARKIWPMDFSQKSTLDSQKKTLAVQT